MKEHLFEQPYDKSNNIWIVKAYFDSIYDSGNFLEAIEKLLFGIGFSIDGAYCSFPNNNSYYAEDHFEGVKFNYGYIEDEEVIIDKEVFYEYIKESCLRYVEKHPNNKFQISSYIEILNRSSS